MGNQKTKSETSKTNSGHVLNTYPISNANTYSNPNANTYPNPNLNSYTNPMEKNQMKKVSGLGTSTPIGENRLAHHL